MVSMDTKRIVLRQILIPGEDSIGEFQRQKGSQICISFLTNLLYSVVFWIHFHNSLRGAER